MDFEFNYKVVIKVKFQLIKIALALSYSLDQVPKINEVVFYALEGLSNIAELFCLLLSFVARTAWYDSYVLQHLEQNVGEGFYPRCRL